jgi:hypothetical protein
MKITYLILLLIFTSCTYQKITINPKEFKPLPSIIFSEIVPSNSFECWKMIESDGGISKDSIFYCSPNCYKVSSQNYPIHFTGFNKNCLPICWFQYIITYKNGKWTFWDNADSLKIFLGSIDNISEAQLLATGFNYYSTSKSIYKKTEDGYLLIMFKLVKRGNPIQTDKFLLHISKSGIIKIQGREVNKKINGII